MQELAQAQLVAAAERRRPTIRLRSPWPLVKKVGRGFWRWLNPSGAVDLLCEVTDIIVRGLPRV